ncbi:MAG: RidA family protein [Gammaproteobacteria bacterium]|jgi:reactive intermediate/imine deaminase|nr:RidA family protein [Gammaproteobacteria bacterium]MBT5863353.1 RidA family protein [Gammaproteobacteria bacterium]MBT6733735.1 RidA family protein [Gammaproteobacteria bacterium]|tara:strand:+ start:1831 stop:2226 length:396 start_codon:yes stop_codon:yes gene_type:complete
MSKKLQSIATKNAPAALGPYSQAIKAGQFIYVSGQIPLIPKTMEIVSDDFNEQAVQVFNNLRAIIEEAGCRFTDIVKINVYLKDLSNFQKVNAIMETFFMEKPFPARAAVEVSRLPKDVEIEMDAVVFSDD